MNTSSRTIPNSARARANNNAGSGSTRPWASGRLWVRAISASMRRSTTWLTTAAAPAHRPMPRLPNSSTLQPTPARVARNMPASEVISISTTTLGLVSSR
ncbi:hypothetical protein D3C76_1485200 [compost metagenome]